MNTYVVKSIVVIIFLLFVICLSVISIWHCFKVLKLGKLVVRHVVTPIILCLITATSLFVGLDYTNPMNRNVPLELYAVVNIPKEYILNNPGEKFWHSAYEAYGLYAEARYFDPNPESYMGFSWPDFDFHNHTYIIVYGQQMKSLSYNVWDNIDTPVCTGAKQGYAVLDDTFDGSKVYIYRIPKMRIDNDP